jgi:hypothetical protein
VYWPSQCLSFAVAAAGSPKEGISAQALADYAVSGLELWTQVACAGGGSPELAVQYRGESECEPLGYSRGGLSSNTHTITFRDTGWRAPLDVIGLTTLTANLDTGEVIDADNEINSEHFDFFVDPEEAVIGQRDLRIVVNHELGHLLGLGHAAAEDSLMYFDYRGPDSTPGADDSAGLCEVFSPAANAPQCGPAPALAACRDAGVEPSASQGGGCGFGHRRASPAAALMLMLLLLSGVARRRRGERRPIVVRTHAAVRTVALASDLGEC